LLHVEVRWKRRKTGKEGSKKEKTKKQTGRKEGTSFNERIFLGTFVSNTVPAFSVYRSICLSA
jgi:hypothetical protein